MESPNDSELIKKARDYMAVFETALRNVPFDDNFIKAVEALIFCEGKIITTGMGKAGIAMRKFSSTLCSLGFPSCYLHPGEASHGDLGLIQDKDILFVASTSGKTREVIETVDSAKNLGISKVIGITSHPDSPIRDRSNICLDMASVKEAGNLGLAPTSSIIVMLAITDSLALVASEEKGITKEEYGTYHHGGYLGAQARGDSTIH